MSSAKRRNHFIPRFLLNRFASRVAQEKHWVWQLSSNTEPLEISTRDVAVATHFYGGPESGVEDAFISVESRFRQILDAIDAGESPIKHTNELRQIFWLHALRTRALREQFIHTADQLLEGLIESFGTAQAREALLRDLETHFDVHVEESLSSLEPFERGAIQHLLNVPAIREICRQSVLEQANLFDFQPFIAQVVHMIRDQGRLLRSAKDGQVRGLAALLENQRVPDAFCPAYWEVLNRSSTPFVLGDACVFAVSDRGAFGSLPRFADSWRELYLPISHAKVLVAKKEVRPPCLTVEEINRASAEVASSYIYASQVTEDIIELTNHIGLYAPLLSQDEFSEIVDEGWRTLDTGRNKETENT